jgi:ferredoxin-NADP reductase
MYPPTFEARLVSTRPLSPGVRELVFERADGGRFDFVAGQWVSLRIPAPDGELKRAYSIASAPNGTPRFELAVTLVTGGPGSTALHLLAPGATVSVTGPQGLFTRDPNATGPTLFVATGTGVAPLRSMLEAAVAAGERRALWMLLGVRHEEDILYRAELEAVARVNANVRFIPTLSRAPDGWIGLRGYVQDHVRGLWAELEARGEGPPHVYVCGLQKMVGAVRDLLRKEMGLPREQVHSERYD